MIYQTSGFDLDFQAFIDSCRTCPDEPELLADLWKLLAPQIFWRDGKITSHAIDHIIIDGQFRVPSAYVAQGLENCHKVTAMGVTVGKRISKETEDCLAKGDLYRASLSDLAGSYGVEQLANRFCSHLQNQNLSRGVYQTPRYSPGYGDWPLAEQKELMAYLDQCPHHIQLTSHLMLVPEKSITALIGWSNVWQKPEYPSSNPRSGFCNGGFNCAACTTWACRKNRL